jgi:hypothetical protein
MLTPFNVFLHWMLNFSGSKPVYTSQSLEAVKSAIDLLFLLGYTIVIYIGFCFVFSDSAIISFLFV